MLELRSVVNKDALKETKKHLIKHKVRVTCSVASLAFFVLGIFFIFVGRYSTTFYCLMGIIFFNVELKIMESNQVKGFLKRMKEVCGTDEVESPVIFEENEIRTKNILSGEEMSVSYDIMEQLIETANYYTLFTKEWQATLIDKASMTEEDRAEFFKLLNEKMPNLKKKVSIEEPKKKFFSKGK